MSRMILKTIYLTPRQDELLREMAKKSRLSVSEHVREGVDLRIASETELSGAFPGEEVPKPG